MILRWADHLADLFGKLSIVFSESEEEAVREFDSDRALCKKRSIR